MSFLFQIPIAMMNSLWFMSILFIIYIILKQLCKLSPSKAFILATSFEIIATLHFIYSVFTPTYKTLKLIKFQVQVSSNLNYWPSFIGLLYGIAVIAYIVYLLIDFKNIKQLKSNADYSKSPYWNQILQKLGLDQYLIGESSILKAPITFGWIDSVILLPFSILNHLSVDEVKFILLHEIAHIIRQDFIIQLLIKCCHVILLFNPFSYFFSKEINIQRELACDQWVIEKMNNPIAYAKSLFQLALVTNKERNGFLLNIIGSDKEILRRIKFINKLPSNSSHLFKQLSFAALVCIVSSIGFTSIKVKESGLVATKKLEKIPSKTIKLVSLMVQKKSLKNNVDQPIEIIELKAPINPPSPIKEEEYNAAVSNAAHWIKERENPVQFANYSGSRDSLEFDIAEKLMLRSLIQHYQLRKELLNAKLATIRSEKEAMDYLENSKEWKEVLQYEKWASTFLKRHPEVNFQDSLSRF